jgi:putative FmdB family regulatory protein
MPAYDYHCERCGDFEVQRRMSDPSLEACPNCSAPVTRLFNRNVNFLFKGGGCYISEYRSEDYKKQEAAEAKAASAPAETKPAAPAPSAAPAAASSGSSTPSPAAGASSAGASSSSPSAAGAA